ncbi:hypothetical protein TVAG_091230 [Trichomonas vaginalis G3]|uniref:NTF2 domain-containing protein n=1 Tax=Trichomonas vaginalis (strain ATCC PRA-98 / G3) TaxID=412133 RepID=A2F625_TRIV3|nr:ribonuclease inhibitor domain-containing protein [Trichomonas vaginalis G3]EAX99654.1 hypothetical protein TVAG_091230 [Trichomonas vaginalis G3]KAI5522421.1 ribonuclease inhibitor domain-containing protein [Trichomonas vaginalis G3]|eukprot:XP_001312584.1 hypothetical protein [Trichomonas vaginalis G3]
MFDLTDIRSHLPLFNANYYVDLQLLFFFIGSFSRKFGFEVDILNLTNNRISNVNVFTKLHNFIPNLKAVILDKNPIQDTTQLTEKMKGMIIRFNGLELGSLYNEDENGFPDVTNPKDIPEIEIPPPQPKSNRYENRSSQGDSEVESFLDKFWSAQNNDIGSTSDFYLQNACFSFIIRNCSRQEPLAALISYNQNLSRKEPGESVTQGSVNISSTQKVIFPSGFSGRIESKSINLVCGIFYSVNLVGNVALEKDSDKMCKFYRQLTIYGVGGQLRIANDVLYLT